MIEVTREAVDAELYRLATALRNRHRKGGGERHAIIFGAVLASFRNVGLLDESEISKWALEGLRAITRDF